MKLLKYLLVVFLLCLTLTACGSGGGGTDGASTTGTSPTSLSVSTRFVDSTKRGISGIPENVAYIAVEVFPIDSPFNSTENIDYVIDTSETTDNTVTFDNLTDYKTYNIEVIALDSNLHQLYEGGATITIQPGENTVTIDVLKFKNALNVPYYWRVGGVFFDIQNNYIDYSVDTTYLLNEGYEILGIMLNIDDDSDIPPDSTILSTGSDSGTSIDPNGFIYLYDDGTHYDYSAGDHIYNIRLAANSFNKPDDIAYIIKVKNPLN